MTKHIGHFETLRGLAATWVFTSHALLIAELPVPILNNGELAVDLFIMLSGFVITLLVLKRPEPYPRYIFRRAVRIYPLYLIALMLGIATNGLYQHVIGVSLFGEVAQSNFLTREEVVGEAFTTHLILHLTMLHGVIPDSILPLSSLAFSGPLWSISLEWQFYLVAPLLIWCLDLRQPGRWRWTALAIAASMAANLLARLAWHADVPAFLPLRLPLFIAGIVSGIYWQRAQETSLRRLGLILFGAVIALMICRISPIPLAAWAVTYWSAAAGSRNTRARWLNVMLAAKPLRWLGERSYGVYVLHMPIVLALSNWFIIPHVASLGRISTFLAELACFPVVVVIAAILYRLCERPLMEWAKGAGRPARTEVGNIGTSHA